MNTLSHYCILEELGRGGMGIVYRARDTKLDREVAIKVLPSAALASADDRARFYREAKAAAALNHPNIAAIHQIDEAIAEDADGRPIEASDGPRPFIAMEFIEGGTLEKRIEQGPLKLDEAVRIATQVAEALKAAHAKDIVHRDIKSANIMLTAEGQAKVLDFGLAQTTASTKLTRMGSTLGTIAYMSPEQARGEEVDGRSDLYSLGTVLYEMVAGRLPFGGTYEQAIVYSILNTDPEPLTALRTGVPMELERITNKLLAKNASRRYQTGADLIADLRSLGDDLLSAAPSASHHSAAHHSTAHHSSAHASTAHHTTAAPTPPRPPIPTWSIVLAALLLLAGGWGLSVVIGPGEPEPRVERLELRMDNLRYIAEVGMSPDERYLAMTGYDWDGNEGLFLFDVQRGVLDYVERSEGAAYPWFSPSGTRLAYSNRMDQSMYIVEVPSGTPQKVVSNSWTSYWVDEDMLLYTKDLTETGLQDAGWMRDANQFYSISQDSSFVVSGTERDASSSGLQWYFPGPRIPGSNYMLGNIQGGTTFGLDSRMFLVDIKKRELIQTSYPGINPQPLWKDIIIYQMGDDAGPVVARRFDPDRQMFTSPAETILEGTFFAGFQANPSTGSLLYIDHDVQNRQVVSFLDRDVGVVESFEIPNQSGQLYSSTLSEDSRTLWLGVLDGETGLSDIVTVDVATGAQRTPLSDQKLDIVAQHENGDLYAFLHDVQGGIVRPEKQLVRFSLLNPSRVDTLTGALPFTTFGGFSSRGIVLGMATQIVILNPGSGAVETLSESAGNLPDVSPDGRFVVFELPTGILAVYDLQDDTLTTLPDLAGEAARWSPDGRSLLYLAFEDIPSRSLAEGYVTRLPVSLEPSFRIAGDAEFVAHVRHPRNLLATPNGVIVVSLGDVSAERPEKRSTYLTLWRNIGRQLDKELPR